MVKAQEYYHAPQESRRYLEGRSAVNGRGASVHSGPSVLNCVRPSAAPLDAAENRQTVRSQLVRRARRFIEAARNLTATTFMNLLPDSSRSKDYSPFNADRAVRNLDTLYRNAISCYETIGASWGDHQSGNVGLRGRWQRKPSAPRQSSG
jgi:hypothetical protein